jgi:hypothetical protein
MKTKPILILLALIILAAVAYVVFKKDAPAEPAPVTENGENTEKPVSLDTLTWDEYQNDELGITMSYPKELVESEFHIQDALTGKIFFGSLKMPSGNLVLLSSVTKDYSSEKDGSWGIGLGYVKQGESYSLKSLKGDLTKVGSTELWPVNAAKSQALVTREKDFPADGLYAANLLVTVNLPTSTFPALGIESMQTGSEILSQQEIEVIKRMVTSITFTK